MPRAFVEIVPAVIPVGVFFAVDDYPCGTVVNMSAGAGVNVIFREWIPAAVKVEVPAAVAVYVPPGKVIPAAAVEVMTAPCAMVVATARMRKPYAGFVEVSAAYSVGVT